MADIVSLTNEDLTVANELQMSTDGEYSIHGDGMFDDLMEAVNVHLSAQFKLSRLQGSDYAKVYTASIQAAMGSAVQYLLGRKDAALIEAQVLKVQAEIELVQTQKDKTLAEIALLNAKRSTEDAQKDVLAEQKLMIAEQAKGFLWNAKQQYMKSILDGQAVNANIEGTGLVDAPYNQSNLLELVEAAKPY